MTRTQIREMLTLNLKAFKNRAKIQVFTLWEIIIIGTLYANSLINPEDYPVNSLQTLILFSLLSLMNIMMVISGVNNPILFKERLLEKLSVKITEQDISTYVESEISRLQAEKVEAEKYWETEIERATLSIEKDKKHYDQKILELKMLIV